MAKLTRIPLDVVVVSTGERTSGKLVAVMVDDLDRIESALENIANAPLTAVGWEMGQPSHIADVCGCPIHQAQRALGMEPI